MLQFTTTILQFEEKGDKSGWTYLEIPADITEQLQPGSRKSFRVKGFLDNYKFQGISLMPLGGRGFMMALNATIRKNIGKRKGAMVAVKIENDEKELQRPAWLIECFEYEPEALTYFDTLAKSHQHYFIKWIESAKTDSTKTKRIAQTITALCNRLGFSEMIRMNKAPKH